MKNTFIAAIVLMAAIITGIFLFKSCSRHIEKSAEKTVGKLAAIRYQDTTTHYIDKAGNQHAEKVQAVGTESQVKAVYEDKLAAVSQQLNIAQKRIQALTSFTLVQHDTILVPVGRWQLKNGDSVFITKDSTIFINNSDSLSIVEYSKRTGFFKRTPVVDIVSYSHGSAITGVQSFRINSGTTSWLSIGPSGALIYTGNQFVPAAGVGVVFKVRKVPVSISILKAFN